jgi:hypothetical protein
MAVSIVNIIPRKQAAAGAETQYTATNKTTVIDKFTVTNTGSVIHVISLFLVASGDSPGDDNCIIKSKGIAVNETYTCPEAIGQVISDAGFISTNADTGSVLTISASGREIT